MGNKIDDIAGKLSKVCKKKPVDWQEFDKVLSGIKNINVIDEDGEESCIRD